jgi:DNA-binding MarR family transcriptional regulator
MKLSLHMWAMLRQLQEQDDGGGVDIEARRACTMIALEKRGLVLGHPFPETGRPKYRVYLLDKGRKLLDNLS